MRTSTVPVLSVVIYSVTVTVAAAQTQTVPFDSPRWQIDAVESRVEEYQGRQCLLLRSGMALVADSQLEDGIIEFDVAFGPQRGFVGATWRVLDDRSREQFYLRPHQSGNPDANQYTPVFNGFTAWQLYHGEGYGAPVTYRFDTWIPIRIVVSGGQAEVYIDDLEKPALFIDELKRAPVSGKVGLTVADFAPARFSNFRYRAVDNPPLRGRVERDRTARPGTVMTWQVSSPISEERLAVAGSQKLDPELRDGLTWRTLRCETTGLANLSRVSPLTRERNTALARVVVESERAQVVGLSFGYSDRIRVYLGNRLLYSGNNGYRTRDYRYLGTIGYFDTVFLPLDKGPNELLLAVSESFGGWGVQAAFDDTAGLTFPD